MTRVKRILFAAAPIALVGVAALIVFMLARAPGAYHEPFDAVGDWGVFGSVNDKGFGNVADGVYYLSMPSAQQRVWALAQRHFDDAVYAVEVTQFGGPLSNGHGFIWRAADEEGGGRFYFFVITADGMFSAGYCVNDCAGDERNLTVGWRETDAIRPGLDVTNTLAVRADGPDFTFYINGAEVWAAHDEKFVAGDIGLMVEAYEEGGVDVMFDNFRVEPLE